MNFFNNVHRSIFEPSFYKEVATFPRKVVVWYFIKLLFFTVIVTGIAHTFYLLHPQRGISSKIEDVFSGMEIIDSILYPNRETPFYPPTYQMNLIWEQFTGNAQVLDNNTDSMLVIDTSKGNRFNGKVPYIFNKKEIVFSYNNVAFNIPYGNLLHNVKHFRFTSEEIRQSMSRNMEFILTFCLTMSLFNNFFLLIFSIFFLGTAAYIFRVEGGYRFFFYLRTACFSVTPIAVGTILIGLSGVRLSWTWHLLIFISTIVMFRAIIASTKPVSGTNEN